MDVPDHFQPFRSSPFSIRLGSLYVARDRGLPVVGLLVEPEHANTLGLIHGGVVATLADTALGQATKTVLAAGQSAVTADLHVRYLGSAAVGSWLEARSVLDKHGSSLIFASTSISVEDTVIATATATFAIRYPREPEAARRVPGGEARQ